MIIILQYFVDEIRKRYPGDTERLGRMSLIQEGYPQYVRMAFLAIVGSHKVNGVAALHSELIRTTVGGGNPLARNGSLV